MSKEDVLDISIPESESATALVKDIGRPEIVETKFGKKARIPLILELDGKEVTVNLFVNPEQKMAHPRSNVYKLLRKAGVTKLKELKGKKVPVRLDSSGFWRLDV